ncbi:macro domain-containing protein [Pseudoalteromonas shioyasakiensis]|uniref:macro domain-containing protein n=1 Tax=Pseudoalteromonas shioyasakiensis TaxID=1190813 RepID=UPI0021175443|nr:macro domain-containing protein [Pseudoalteromonas shioyasakiensis]MCQ8879691.1 macro domain-containing protein [Pseudoalteromonas shioyasakiensis]
MGVKVISGNIFNSKCDFLVNPVNCDGVMGAGLALEFKLRYPEMFIKYEALCEAKKLNIGLLWIYKSELRSVLNFPTKLSWKYPSKESYLNQGLKKFVDTYQIRNIESIAFPILGGGRGGIDSDVSLAIMQLYLSELNIDIEIYDYSATANDDLYIEFAKKITLLSSEQISVESGVKIIYIERILEAIKEGRIYQLNQLLSIQGVGIKTVEKIFAYSQKLDVCVKQNDLFS